MSICEEDKYSWLIPEKKFIADAIEQKKILLGICLGSQLIADVLGGSVGRNPYKEIGWFPVSLTEEAGDSPIFGAFPSKFTAFHWHGDTFKIPPGARRIARSEACRNQAFEYGRVIGLQFHLEYSEDSINLMFKNCRAEITDGKYIQKPDEIVSKYTNTAGTKKLLDLMLDNMEREFGC